MAGDDIGVDFKFLQARRKRDDTSATSSTASAALVGLTQWGDQLVESTLSFFIFSVGGVETFRALAGESGKIKNHLRVSKMAQRL